jgi:hypothetical protein
MEALSGCAGGVGAVNKLAKLLKKAFGCNSFTADTLVLMGVMLIFMDMLKMIP